MMNRQQRRRIEKEILKDFSSGNIRKTKEEYDQRMKERDYELVNKFLVVCQEALRLEFGFGEKRLGKFGARVESILDCINDDYVSFEDLEKEYIKE